MTDLQLLRESEPAPPDGRFAWLVTGAHTWILVGLFRDGWFHIHGPENEWFFTPWHGVLLALTTGSVLTIQVTRDVAWSRELLTGSIGSAAATGYLLGWLVQNGGVSQDRVRADSAA